MKMRRCSACVSVFGIDELFFNKFMYNLYYSVANINGIIATKGRWGAILQGEGLQGRILWQEIQVGFGKEGGGGAEEEEEEEEEVVVVVVE